MIPALRLYIDYFQPASVLGKEFGNKLIRAALCIFRAQQFATFKNSSLNAPSIVRRTFYAFIIFISSSRKLVSFSFMILFLQDVFTSVGRNWTSSDPPPNYTITTQNNMQIHSFHSIPVGRLYKRPRAAADLHTAGVNVAGVTMPGGGMKGGLIIKMAFQMQINNFSQNTMNAENQQQRF